MSFKWVRASAMGHALDSFNKSPFMDRLVGPANEVEIFVEGHSTQALLDTGSMISTISQSLCEKLTFEVEPLQHLLKVEVAGGYGLKYIGYVEVNVDFPDLKLPGPILLLVVQDTVYHNTVPVLLGTNVLQNCQENANATKVCSQQLPTSWKFCFMSLAKHQHTMSNVGSLGSVKTTKSTTVPANGRALVHGITHAITPCMKIYVGIEETIDNTLPGGLVVTPAISSLHPGKSTNRMSIEVTNYSAKSVVIPASTKICDLHHVDLVPPCSEQNQGKPEGKSPKPFLDHFQGLDEHLEHNQVSEVQQLLLKWQNVFSLHDLDLGHTHRVQHKIKLTDHTPFKERPRRIPPAMINVVRQHLQEMLELGVISKSESPYSSNIVLVRKKDGTLRFCIDLRKLNPLTVHDSYALPRIEESLDALQGAKWLCVRS
jgi:hypothetical protein